MLLKQKVIRAETKLIDEDEGLVSAVVSTERVDSDGDVIRQRFWDMERFLTHPVLISGHDYRSLQKQIGTWVEMTVKGSKMQGIAKYFIGAGNDEADWAFELAKQGQAAFSVGFNPDMSKAKPLGDTADPLFGPFEFRGQELLEVSQVTIPANPDALQRMKAAGLHPVLEGIVDDMLGKPDGGGEYLAIEELAGDIVSRLEPRLYSLVAEILEREEQSVPPTIDYKAIIDSAFKQAYKKE